jgi:Rrf2 family iron-sulfur cluster assembly transcriptional regulator
MIYTGSAKYAIRAMVCLAINNVDGKPFSAAGVAEAEQIPPFYLAKVLQDLGRAGLLKSARGRGGGFFLSRPADEITLIEVIGAVEDSARLESECVLGIDECNDEAACPMHDTWKAFRDSALDALRTLTVANLVTELLRKKKAGVA